MALAPMLYWSAVILGLGGAVSLAVVATTSKRPTLMYSSAGLLALTLVVMAVSDGIEMPAAVGVVLGLLALALSVVGGGPVTVLVLHLATRAVDGPLGGILVGDRPASPSQIQESPSQIQESASQIQESTEVLLGGRTIGYLERFATTGSILAGFPAAVAVIVAIKGVGRFSELADSQARERFIIGTLVSLSWAAACAAILHLPFS